MWAGRALFHCHLAAMFPLNGLLQPRNQDYFSLHVLAYAVVLFLTPFICLPNRESCAVHRDITGAPLDLSGADIVELTASARAPQAHSSRKVDVVGQEKRKSGIKAPRLPKVLPLAELLRDLPADGESYARMEYQHLDIAESTISRLHFEEVVFTQLIATGTQCDFLRAEDVRFAGCNLANAAWPNLSCVRIEFTGCRMTGFSTLEAVLIDAVFKECKVDLAQFYKGKMRGVRFEDCALTGADFRMADLTEAAFIRCDLSQTDFTGAKLTGADLRGCQIEGMRAGANELHGATIDEVQALALVRAMGITIS